MAERQVHHTKFGLQKKRANLPDLTFYITTKMAYDIREDVIRLKNSFLG